MILKKNSKNIDFKYLGKKWPIKTMFAETILDNKVIAIFNNSMEYGPRALGNRSIMASKCINPKMRDILNLKSKKKTKISTILSINSKEDREKTFIKF